MDADPLPLELPRLVMQRTLALALAALLAIAALGLLRAGHDIDDELDGALALAEAVAQLSRAGAAGGDDDDAVLARLRAALAARPLRHLDVQVADAADGRLLLAPAPAPPAAWPLDALLGVHRALHGDAAPQQVAWTLPRGPGRAWTVSLAATPESERREALAELSTTLLLVAGCIAALIAAMQWNLRRAFRPLAAIVRAIEGIEQRDAAAVRRLPPMPIRELQTIATAIEHLATSLQRTEDERRRLGHRLLTLQEDERSRLARELHDEFGQRLTALRVDAAWLSRRLGAADAEAAAVVLGMSERCAELQHDIRGLLERLRPLGPQLDAADEPPTLQRLAALLRALCEGWAGSAGRALAVELRLRERGADGVERALADDGDAARRALPPELLLGLYRLSQEALTNVARHAGASAVELRLVIEPQPGGALALDWSVQDDGVGIADLGAAMQQGSGLGGMRERVWALGGELQCRSPAPRGGLGLSARLGWSGA